MTAVDAALEFWLMNKSREGRDRLVGAYRHLQVRAARKFYRSGLDRADLEQIAAIGLLKACDRYDPALKTPFEAFAWLFIVGELMHYVRDYERMVRPPRRLRSLERRFAETAEQLMLELGRTPTTREVSNRLGVPCDEVEELARYREFAVPESLETLEAHKLRPCSYTIEGREDRMLLDAALAALTSTERTIILALYGTGYRQHEVAQRLGYSRRHISRLHRSALKKMRPFWVPKSA